MKGNFVWFNNVALQCYSAGHANPVSNYVGYKWLVASKKYQRRTRFKNSCLPQGAKFMNSCVPLDWWILLQSHVLSKLLLNTIHDCRSRICNQQHLLQKCAVQYSRDTTTRIVIKPILNNFPSSLWPLASYFDSSYKLQNSNLPCPW